MMWAKNSFRNLQRLLKCLSCLLNLSCIQEYRTQVINAVYHRQLIAQCLRNAQTLFIHMTSLFQVTKYTI